MICLCCEYEIEDNITKCPVCDFIYPSCVGSTKSYEETVSPIAEAYRRAKKIIPKSRQEEMDRIRQEQETEQKWKANIEMMVQQSLIQQERIIELLTKLVGHFVEEPIAAVQKSETTVIFDDHDNDEYPEFAVNDRYMMGHYQGEEINWRVLAVENNKALLITEQAIDAKEYDERYQSITWENCTLRKWLNSEFYRSAFTEQEKRKILETSVRNKDNEEYGTSAGNDTRDQVFLLSSEEANKLFRANEDRICKPTPYTKKKGCWTNDAGNCWWWLRSPGNHGLFGLCAAGVNFGGEVFYFGNYVFGGDRCVRPALWINLCI